LSARGAVSTHVYYKVINLGFKLSISNQTNIPKAVQSAGLGHLNKQTMASRQHNLAINLTKHV